MAGREVVPLPERNPRTSSSEHAALAPALATGRIVTGALRGAIHGTVHGAVEGIARSYAAKGVEGHPSAALALSGRGPAKADPAKIVIPPIRRVRPKTPPRSKALRRWLSRF
ncbi:MAG: hypothetical protein AAFR60_07785 [Pseudomonadota bacterium]